MCIIGFVVERLKRRKQNGTDQKNNINNRKDRSEEG